MASRSRVTTEGAKAPHQTAAPGRLAAHRGCGKRWARRPGSPGVSTGLSFCDARGLGAFVQIANRADAAGCRLASIAPRPQVAKVLRVGGLNSRIPVFATTAGALAQLPVPVLASRHVSASPS
jgi:hypothetical protein